MGPLEKFFNKEEKPRINDLAIREDFFTLIDARTALKKIKEAFTAEDIKINGSDMLIFIPKGHIAITISEGPSYTMISAVHSDFRLL